jgi:ubiquinone/menaquinone biosynthesis C-methylase UbiE
MSVEAIISTEEMTREKFNALKRYYDKTWDAADHTLHVGLFRDEGDSLAQAYAQATNYLIKGAVALAPITKHSVILDVGCGTGKTLMDLCKKFGCRGVGIDISDEQIKEAEARSIGLSTRFIRASGSDLSQVFAEDGQFTHVISQDAIFLVADKQTLFRDIARLLVPGGVFAVADFLSEDCPQERSTSEEQLVYQLVNWTNALSFETYRKALETVGLVVVRTERRDADMIQTYERLTREMAPYTVSGDTTYAELQARYESIAAMVCAGKMGWGFFFAQKQ